MESIKLNKGKILLFFIIGLLMSGLSTQVCEKIGIPTVPELFYLPLLFSLRRDFVINKTWRNTFAALFFVWLFLLICAIVNGRFPFAYIMSTAKAYLIMFFFIAIFRNIQYTSKLSVAIFTIVVASIIGWGLNVYLKFAGVFPMGSDFVTYGNMVAVSIAISFVIIVYRKPVIIIPVLIIVIFISVASALRRLILVSVISIVVSYLINSILVKKSFKSSFAVLLIGLSFFLILPAIESTVEDISPILHHRVFNKTRKASFDSDITEDNVREENFNIIQNEIPTLILPHGFVSKNTSKNEVGIFVDNPFYEIFYTIGVPFGLLLIIVYLAKLKRLLKICFKTRDKDQIVWFAPGVVCFMLLFIDSTYLSWSYITPSTGAVVGLLFKYGKRAKTSITIK